MWRSLARCSVRLAKNLPTYTKKKNCDGILTTITGAISCIISVQWKTFHYVTVRAKQNRIPGTCVLLLRASFIYLTRSDYSLSNVER